MSHRWVKLGLYDADGRNQIYQAFSWSNRWPIEMNTHTNMLDLKSIA